MSSLDKTIKVRWWIIFNAILAGLTIAGFKGAFAFAWLADTTKLSFFTWFVFLLVTGFIGYLTLNHDNPSRDVAQDKRYINACWFASEMLMGLGLIGTVLAVMKTAILSMSTGLTTAFVTTLSGITTSLLVKLQLINYEVNKDEK